MTPRALVPLAFILAAACGSSGSSESKGDAQAAQGVPQTTPTPVTWIATAAFPDGRTGTVTLDATIESGWHVYSVSQPAGGPIPTRITLPPDQGIGASGAVRASPPPRTQFDSAFTMNVEEHEGHAQFALPVSVAASGVPSTVRVNVRYQACNASFCLPPQTARLTAAVSRHRGS